MPDSHGAVDWLRLPPRTRGGWIVATDHDDIRSQHANATDAELAAVERLADGGDLVVIDRYSR